MPNTLTISYLDYKDISGLESIVYGGMQFDGSYLMREALNATGNAYAPYSHFSVGAALLLADGTVVCGSNQENCAYPSGLCAERTALFAASAQRPEVRDYVALAIAARDAKGRQREAAPCGACRQVMAEFEGLQGHPMRVMWTLEGGGVRMVERVADLLPFGFVL